MSGTRVCALADLARCSVRRVEVDGVAVALARVGDELFAISDICSHGNVSLSEGELWCDEREVECWKHGSTFDLRTGEPQSLPATVPVPVFSVRVEDGQVVVDVDGVAS